MWNRAARAARTLTWFVFVCLVLLLFFFLPNSSKQLVEKGPIANGTFQR